MRGKVLVQESIPSFTQTFVENLRSNLAPNKSSGVEVGSAPAAQQLVGLRAHSVYALEMARKMRAHDPRLDYALYALIIQLEQSNDLICITAICTPRGGEWFGAQPVEVASLTAEIIESLQVIPAQILSEGTQKARPSNAQHELARSILRIVGAIFDKTIRSMVPVRGSKLN